MAATFAYKVRDKQGQIRTGKIEGQSQSLVVKSLREKGLTPISVEEQKNSALQMEIKIPGLSDRVKAKDVVLFSRQFATMVNSGLSLIRALAVLVDQTESSALALVIRNVRSDVEKGTSLSQAMEKHPKVFGELYVAMIKAGEVGGVLDETLERLADMLEANLNLRSKIKSAMAYPIVVGVLILFVTTAMIVFVVPIFADMYDEMGGGAALPAPTLVLVALSNIMTSYWWALILGTVGSVVAFRKWKSTESGRYYWDTIKLKIPVFGKLAHKTSLSRFARTFAVLSRTGVPILQAIDIVSATSGNRKMSRALEDVKASVRDGESLAEPLSRHDIFPPMVVQMMTVGEETGALDAMLGKVSDFYNREVDDMVNALTSLIEPLLIVVMGITVGGILIALYLPIFNLAAIV
ncbi:Type IV fimbrial assembly protein PilC [hydrothermal vent metagenome]|uniref:Type IV fimbrial assembly protein PilC n=1 Tax=hydrothermal vent metagenome TaxID=652676 RepID=A0A3B0T0K9_9ZZZZ